jgi:hypothetical protein
MKKLSFIVIIILLAIIFTACIHAEVTPSNTSTTTSEVITSEPTTTNIPTQPQTTWPANLPKYIDGSIKLHPQSELEGVGEYELHYRYVYYCIDGFYGLLAPSNDAVNEFMQPFYDNNDVEDNVMLLAEFVKHFNIPREKFDEATQRLIAAIQELGEDMTDERYEVPNGDIIYTFDNDIINEYYRRA